MSFNKYKSIADVIREFPAIYQEDNFIGDIFTKNIRYYVLENLDNLMGAINFIFAESSTMINGNEGFRATNPIL